MEDGPTASDDAAKSGGISWNLIALFAVPMVFSLFSGCIQHRENQAKHEQILGEIEKVRQEVRGRRN